MKLQNLREISRTTGRSKKEHIQAILEIGRMAMIHSTVYGEFEIVEKDDHLDFRFQSEHYGEIIVPFSSRDELERIKDNLRMAYYEAEDISRDMRENETITETTIAKANSFFEALNQSKSETITSVTMRLKGLEKETYFELKPLLDIYAVLNRKILEVTFTEIYESTKDAPFLKNNYLPFKQYIKLA
ncbi:hypothetical protein [Exiguobacterium acetylicum]|uniref:Uncharacterized protein n=1 Tax=Exiguobacterium acetylicum TaxID=41170 RepID=A0ABX8GEA5_EXIAC|nr:hypothetical protein [Exiguobacterium acetylicum]QWB31984.1 hypothetical protein KKI46_17645 [Exiguobacterium acetylicum]